MSLKACRECGAQVSTAAASCPHCGVKSPTSSPLASNLAKGIPGVIMLVFVLYVLSQFKGETASSASPGQIAASDQVAPASPPDPPKPSCKTEWKLCSDNADLVNNYDGVVHAQVMCKEKANDESKYGSPQWPWLIFSRFMPGTNYSEYGIVTLIDREVKFQNQYGTYEKTMVTCTFNFVSDEVTYISVDPQ